MRILVLSPHRDDAAFSLTSAMRSWIKAGHAVTVLNVFTRSSYAPYASLQHVPDELRLGTVSAIRKREDRQALGSIGVQHIIDLELFDAPIRLECDSSIVCDMDVVANDDAIPAIQAAVQHYALGIDLSQEQRLALVLPLALGHHVDHCTVRDAALPLAIGLPCAFYEDLPYAMRDGVDLDLSSFSAAVERHYDERLKPVISLGTVHDQGEYRLSVALLYDSQIDRQLATRIAQFAERDDGADRLWVNESWLSLAGVEGLSGMFVEQTEPRAR